MAQQPYEYKTIEATEPGTLGNQAQDDTLRIAFTSCAHQRGQRLFYKNMRNVNPDVVILAGDNIYVDSLPKCECCGAVGWSCMGSGVCIKRPRPFLDHDEEYTRLLERSDCGLGDPEFEWTCPILATWDDHDFGGDGSDCTYKDKERSKNAFIRFFRRIDSNGMLREQIEQMEEPGRGVQYFYDIQKERINARIYMLDNRWYRTDDDILGAVQWEWLDKIIVEAKKLKINRHIFVNGTTMLSPLLDFRCLQIPEETWPADAVSQFRELLIKHHLLSQSFLVSGDVHMSLVSRNFGVHEFVYSAMTHSLLSPALWLFRCCVCAKSTCRPCSCCECLDGEPESRIVNVNGFGVLDFKPLQTDFSVLSGDETMIEKTWYSTSLEYSVPVQGQLEIDMKRD